MTSSIREIGFQLRTAFAQMGEAALTLMGFGSARFREADPLIRVIDVTDPLAHLKGLRECSKVYSRKCREAFDAGDWDGVEAMWRAQECLVMEIKHAEIDFDRKIGRVPPLNASRAKARLLDTEAEIAWIDVVIARCEKLKAESEGKS